MTLLSQWGKQPQPITVKIDPSVDMQTPPVEQVKKMTPDAYFAYAAELLKVNGPHLIDQPQLARMKRLGFEAGRSFDVAEVDLVIREALQMAPAAAQSALIAEWPKVGRTANGWVMNTDSGVYGTNYLKRGAVAMFEIGMNRPEDAIYPDTGISPLDGRNKYVIHFAKGELPPVNEFWSVTVYDLQGFHCAESGQPLHARGSKQPETKCRWITGHLPPERKSGRGQRGELATDANPTVLTSRAAVLAT
jgi:hypothetical protein